MTSRQSRSESAGNGDGPQAHAQSVEPVHSKSGLSELHREPPAFFEQAADYLKGAGYLARYDVTGKLDLALASFQSALRHDPNYALAYSGLAGVYRWKAETTGEKEWSELSIKNAAHAVQLQPGLAGTHATLGAVYGKFGREEDAIAEFQRALQISPGDGEVFRDLGEILEPAPKR